MKVKNTGNCNIYDLLADAYYSYECDGEIDVTLSPYQSLIIVFEEDCGFEKYVDNASFKETEISPEFDVTLYESEKPSEIFASFKTSELSPISSAYPDFSGRIEYDFAVESRAKDRCFIEFENVGENAELYVGEKLVSMRICPPYRFDITDFVGEKECKMTLKVYTTLGNSVKDPVSMFTAIEPTGAWGKVKIKTF